MRRWRSWRCRSAPSGTFARSRCGVPGAGVSGDPRVALKVRAGSRLGAPAWRGTPPRSSAGVRVDAGQERHREWRRGAVIQGREDVVRLEGITRKRAEKEGHDDRQNVESPDVGQLETHVTGALPNDLDQKGNDPPTAPKSSCRAVPNASPVKTQGNRNVDNDLRNVPIAPSVRDRPKRITRIPMSAH